MTSSSARTSTTTVLFLTDLHLDRTGEAELDHLLSRIKITDYDCAIVTGDISDAKNLRRHLSQLAAACAPKPLYILMGNHDYYGGSFKVVDDDVEDLCKSTFNLHHLDGSRVIQLTDGIGLLGHRGWPDARAGEGMKTEVKSRDGWSIKDLQHLEHSQMLDRMLSLGRESAAKIRRIFPLALARYRHVIVATHVPPFDNAVFHKGKSAASQHLPHFCNVSVGVMLIGILRAFPRRRVTVIAGHSHGACDIKITSNLSVRVGSSRVDGMIPFELLRFAA